MPRSAGVELYSGTRTKASEPTVHNSTQRLATKEPWHCVNGHVNLLRPTAVFIKDSLNTYYTIEMTDSTHMLQCNCVIGSPPCLPNTNPKVCVQLSSRVPVHLTVILFEIETDFAQLK